MELVKIENNKDYGLVVSSRVIADKLGRRHDHIIRDLEKILENPNVGSLIIPSFYRAKNQRRQYKEYLLTKDGFTLYMFNIQGYVDFKMAYINKFNEMERALKNNTVSIKVPTVPMFQKLNHQGERVMTIGQLAILLGVNTASIHHKTNLLRLRPKQLMYRELAAFKRDNEMKEPRISTLNILNYSEAMALAESFACDERQRMHLNNYFDVTEIIPTDKTPKVPDLHDMNIEEKYIAITQAELLIRLGKLTDDKLRREFMFMRATNIIISIGIYDGSAGGNRRMGY